MVKEELAVKANRLPMLPGVYIMMDSSGNVIYVGKAKKLKNRVSSYFHGEHLPKVSAMVEKVYDFNIIVVSSEMEALVLENSLIKQHKPHYNILLKDDKGYPFIRIDTSALFPSISLCNRVQKDNAKYYGPFGARKKTREIITLLRKAYQLPDCNLIFPRDIGKYRPCLNYHIGNCSGWCLENRESEYRLRINQISKVLQGHSDDIIAELKKEMKSYSDELDFEHAAVLRDRINLLQSLQSKQSVFSTSIDSTDVIGYKKGTVCCFAVIKYSNGNLVDKDFRIIDVPLESDPDAICELIKQYYHSMGGQIPKTILIPTEIDFEEGLSEFLSEIANHPVRIEFPKRGLKNDLLKMAERNAEEEISRYSTEKEKKQRINEVLSKTLGITGYLRRIEAYDISNLGNTGIVSGMTVYINGNKDKKEYRRFRLSELSQQNDFESMYITVYRRLKAAKDGKKGFTDIPDLILVDGGLEQVSFAQKAMAEVGYSIPIFGMVKDDRHHTRALISSTGNEVSINTNPALFSYIGSIQEETHRYTLQYQKTVRNCSLESQLNDIPGVGNKRKELIMQKFSSVSEIAHADLKALKSILPNSVAVSVFNHYHKDGDTIPCVLSQDNSEEES